MLDRSLETAAHQSLRPIWNPSLSC
jgi:hypothetical protein